MSERRALLRIAALVATALALGFVIAVLTTEPSDDEVSSAAAPPKPGKRPAIVGSPKLQRVSLPPPDDREVPQQTSPREPLRLGPDEYREYNFAVDRALREAREACVQSFIDDQGAPLEFVFDVVLLDGRVSDFGLRTMSDVPPAVLECFREWAWNADWPEQQHHGELRLQRALTWDPTR